MKLLKLLYLAPVLFLFILASTTPFSGCTKDKIIHDTVTVRHDTTIIKHDTLVKTDSIYDVQEGLVAYFNFNGGSLHDSSGYHNDIIFNNAVATTDRFGRSGNAYLFDGINSYMRIKNSASLNPSLITIMAILKFNGFNAGTCHINQILMKGSQDPDPGVYGLRVISADGQCATPLDTATEKFIGTYGDYGNSSYALNTSYLIRTTKWVTVIYTYDGYTSKIYVDGQLQSTNILAAQFTANGYDIYIGRTQNPSFPYPFTGVIDELRIYNRPLGAGAVQQLINQNNK